jgi:flagellar motor switch protein FliN/FliY
MTTMPNDQAGQVESLALPPNDESQGSSRGGVAHNPLSPAGSGAQRKPVVDEAPPTVTPPPKREPKPGIAGVAFVMDVPVELSVEIGRRRTRIAELLQLSPGSVLELDTAAGDPLSIYVNKRLVAHGEAVMVGDRYGVRIVGLLIEKDDPDGAGR